jgi:hypothetical protein
MEGVGGRAPLMKGCGGPNKRGGGEPTK